MVCQGAFSCGLAGEVRSVRVLCGQLWLGAFC